MFADPQKAGHIARTFKFKMNIWRQSNFSLIALNSLV